MDNENGDRDLIFKDIFDQIDNADEELDDYEKSMKEKH